MKNFMVKGPALILLVSMLGLTACSTTGETVTTTTVPTPTKATTVVTTPAKPVPPIKVTPPQKTTPAPSPKYVVQLIASKNASKANTIKQTFNAKGYQTYVSPLNVNGQTLHRVQVGPYASESDAYTVLQQMRQHYGTNLHVRSAVVKTIYGS